MKETPSISVIMPVFNGEKFVNDSIVSVIKQTLQPTELFLIDDGSTDNSLDIIKKIETPFPKYILEQKNKFQSAARNLAAKKAIGKYLAFIDHDDIWYPYHLEKLVEPLENDDRFGWSYSDLDEIDSDGGLICTNTLRVYNHSVDHPKVNIFNMLASDMFIFPSASLVRTDALLAIKGFDERLSGYEDDDLFLRLFRAGWLNCFIPESLLCYRRHAVSSSFSSRMWISREIFAQKLLDNYPDDPVLVRYYIRDIIAPRFYNASQEEYIRHLPHRRWDQCMMAIKEMRRYSKKMKFPMGLTRFRRFIDLQILAHPRLFRLFFPLLRRLTTIRYFRIR